MKESGLKRAHRAIKKKFRNNKVTQNPAAFTNSKAIELGPKNLYILQADQVKENLRSNLLEWFLNLWLV